MTKEERDRLRALCDAAAPGPWRLTDDTIVDADDEAVVGDVFPYSVHGTKQCKENARFVAASRTAVPALLDDLYVRDAYIARLVAALHDARFCIAECIDNEARAGRMYMGGVCPTGAADVLEGIDIALMAEPPHG
jgi:hypothetical protein